MTRADLDEPTFQSAEWTRRVGALEWEQVPQVGTPHERAAQPEPMHWTAAPPNAQGWWWNRDTTMRIAVPVYVMATGYTFVMDDPNTRRYVDVRGRWLDEWSSAPIAEPVG